MYNDNFYIQLNLTTVNGLIQHLKTKQNNKIILFNKNFN